MKSERGQMTIEMIMITMVLMIFAVVVKRAAARQQWAESLVSGPWLPMKAMIEDGVWTTQDSKTKNPNLLKRHASYEADEVP